MLQFGKEKNGKIALNKTQGLGINVKYLTLIIIFFIFTGCVAEKKVIPPLHNNTQVIQLVEDSSISKSHTNEVKEKVNIPVVVDFNGTWLAQATATFTQRKLSLNKVNNSLQGTLEIKHITSRGEVFDTENFDVIIYLKGESIEGYISSGASTENISIFRDSSDAFTLKVKNKESKYFDTNEIRFIKYTTKQSKEKKVELISMVWQDSIANKVLKSDYYAALEYCKNLDYLGKTDWFLPTRTQLITTINNNKFKNKINGDYWSQTASLDQYGKAWYVDYKKAQMSIDLKIDKKYIRCIRKKVKNEKVINKGDGSIADSNRSSSRK